ncbi:MAG: hypothetical protein K2N86_04540 [Rikenellaceae bacterium]|nr:hypothetical protein [Rikenellaceae bacterium]
MYCIYLEEARRVELCGVLDDGVSLLIDGRYFYVTFEDVFYINNCNFGEVISRTLARGAAYDRRNYGIS